MASAVRAELIDLDPSLVTTARRSAGAAGLTNVEVVRGDASVTDAYARIAPVHVMLVCGVFGNVSDEDVCTTIGELPHLVTAGATVIWTRHRLPPDLTPAIRRWFLDAGFEEIGFDASEGFAFGVGTARFTGEPRPLRAGRRMFRFGGDGRPAHD